MSEPTRAQLLHLADRARRGALLPDEGALLADAVTAMAERLDRANKAIRFMLGWESAAHVAELEQRAGQAEAAIERVRNLAERWEQEDLPERIRIPAVAALRTALGQAQQTTT